MRSVVMPSDSDPILIFRQTPDSLTDIIADCMTTIQYKLLGTLFIVFVFISSDVFINRVLGGFRGAVEYKSPTSWGVILQGLFLVIAVMILDMLIRQQII